MLRVPRIWLFIKLKRTYSSFSDIFETSFRKGDETKPCPPIICLTNCRSHLPRAVLNSPLESINANYHIHRVIWSIDWWREGGGETMFDNSFPVLFLFRFPSELEGGTFQVCQLQNLKFTIELGGAHRIQIKLVNKYERHCNFNSK